MEGSGKHLRQASNSKLLGSQKSLDVPFKSVAICWWGPLKRFFTFGASKKGNTFMPLPIRALWKNPNRDQFLQRKHTHSEETNNCWDCWGNPATKYRPPAPPPPPKKKKQGLIPPKKNKNKKKQRGTPPPGRIRCLEAEELLDGPLLALAPPGPQNSLSPPPNPPATCSPSYWKCRISASRQWKG